MRVTCATLSNGRYHVILRRGDYMTIYGHPCKIVDIDNCLMKRPIYHYTGIDIFTGDKYEDLYPPWMRIDVPLITHLNCKLLKIDTDNYTALICENGDVYDHIKLPDGHIGNEIKKYFEDDSDIKIILTHATMNTDDDEMRSETFGITSYKVEEKGYDFQVTVGAYYS